MADKRRQYRAFIADHERTDDGNLVVIISTGEVDRFNTILDPAGWDLRNYKRNPVVMWAHQREQLPIASCQRVWVEGDKLKALVDWTEAVKINPFAAQVKAYYDAGLLRGWSVGFIPVETEYPDGPSGFGPMSPSQRGDKAKPITFRKMELVEFSAAPIPANPGTLTENALLTRAVSDATGLDEKFVEMIDASVPEGSRRSPVIGQWIAGVYERAINDRVDMDAKPGDQGQLGNEKYPENVGGGRPFKREEKNKKPFPGAAPPFKKGRAHDVLAKAKPTSKQCSDESWLLDHPEWQQYCMDQRVADVLEGERAVPDEKPCCGNIDDKDLEDMRVEGRALGDFDPEYEAYVDRILSDEVEGRIDWSKIGSGHSKREEIPDHVFLKAGKKYPYKQKKGGAWVVSCKDLRDAISQSNAQKDTAVSSKAQKIYAKECAKKSWDVDGARERVSAWAVRKAGSDNAGARALFAKACAWGTRLCHHDVEDGHLVTSAAGVREAMAKLLLSSADMRATSEWRAAYEHLARHFEQFGMDIEEEARAMRRANGDDNDGPAGGKPAGRREPMVGSPTGGMPFKHRHMRKLRAAMRSARAAHRYVRTAAAELDKAYGYDYDPATDQKDGRTRASEAIDLLRELGVVGERGEAALRELTERKVPKAAKAAREEPPQPDGNVLPGEEDDEANEEIDDHDPGPKGPHGRADGNPHSGKNVDELHDDPDDLEGSDQPYKRPKAGGKVKGADDDPTRKIVNIEDTKPEDEEAWRADANAGDKDPDMKASRRRRRAFARALRGIGLDEDEIRSALAMFDRAASVALEGYKGHHDVPEPDGNVEAGEEDDEANEEVDDSDPGPKGPHGRKLLTIMKELGLDLDEIAEVRARMKRVEMKEDIGQGGPDAEDDDPKGGKAPGPVRKRERKRVEKALRAAGFDDESVTKALDAWDRSQETGMVAAGEEDDDPMHEHDDTPEPHEKGGSAGKQAQDHVVYEPGKGPKMDYGLGDDVVIELEVPDVEDR